MEQLHEFPVLIEDTGEVITLFLKNEEMERASQDSKFLQDLIAKERGKNINNSEPIVKTNNINENVDNDEKSIFSWPDKAILLLIEMYREREEEFSNSFKRNNKIWAEIAAEMNKVNPAYKITPQQCTSKMSGLKRTYKNIIDMNKKSGNNKNSWAFFSVMDSLFGDKASIRPPAIATSDGPSDPNQEESCREILPSTSKSPPEKKRRMEKIMEEFIQTIVVEKEERKEEMIRREANREKIREEKKVERERRHNEQMSIQKSLVSILQQFLNK